ncbi:MAG: glutathione binding-like protein, partial [bacterium]
SNITWGHVERTYRKSLSLLEAIFSQRPFVLGRAPTLADIALMGPMLRHFGQDPTPVEIMRNDAPGVYDWITRVWNAKEGNTSEEFAEGIPADLNPLLQEICETHLAHLDLNADAYGQGKTRFNGVIQGQIYTALSVSRYRVWCLESLQVAYRELDAGDREIIGGVLDQASVQLLSTARKHPSEYDVNETAPFNRAINVYGHGVPVK